MFLDNAGLLFQEQVARSVFDRHMDTLRHLLMKRWELLQRQILPMEPWWGDHFNPDSRKANAGEPRGLLRFLGDRDLADLSDIFAAMGLPDTVDAPPRWSLPDDAGMAHSFDPWSLLPKADRAFRFDDWSASPFVGHQPRFGREVEDAVFHGGLVLPTDFPSVVDQIRVLPPWAATPDLKLRVGMEDNDRLLYDACGRNQGALRICVANAVATALDIAARRQVPAYPSRFSAAWLHVETGDDRRAGRDLADVMAFVRHGLLCQETTFEYPTTPEALQRWADSTDAPPRDTVAEDDRRIRQSLGALEVRPLRRYGEEWDIPSIKSHLAAGWVVVVGTAVPDEVLRSPGLQHYGAMVCPTYAVRDSQAATRGAWWATTISMGTSNGSTKAASSP